MNGGTVAMLVVLALGGPARAPDLQVEATTSSGGDLPELTDAVARALVAGGARVVLRPPASEPCSYCAKVAVVQSGTTFRVAVSQERHRASATLRLPPGSPLLDRARAIAIQARLLVTWDTSAEARPREIAGRMAPPKYGGGALAERPLVPPPSAPAAVPSAGALPTRESAPSLEREPERPPAREPVAVGRPREVLSPVAPKPLPRVEPRPVARVEAEPPAKDRPPATDARATPAAREPEPKPRAELARAEDDGALSGDLTAAAPEVHKPLWPWLPTAIGASAAVGAGICALVARERYNGLSDRTQTYANAQALKTEGENWQLASFVLAGVAVAGVATGVVGFATRSPVPVAAPVPGGGMVAIAGALP
jgi:hypothetical protein